MKFLNEVEQSRFSQADTYAFLARLELALQSFEILCGTRPP
jgi:hypothetical protein